eukprot:3797322-Rhodomonas_salina.1
MRGAVLRQRMLLHCSYGVWSTEVAYGATPVLSGVGCVCTEVGYGATQDAKSRARRRYHGRHQ